MIVSNCWSASDSSVPQTVSYERRGFDPPTFLTNCPASSGSGSKHTHRPEPTPGSRNRVFDPIPAPTSRMSPRRNGCICPDQYAFQFHLVANRGNSEPIYLNSLIRIDGYVLLHKQLVIPDRPKAQIRSYGKHKQYKLR